MRTLRRYFMADDDETVHWSDYAWLTAGYGVPIAVVAFTVLSIN